MCRHFAVDMLCQTICCQLLIDQFLIDINLDNSKLWLHRNWIYDVSEGVAVVVRVLLLFY